MNKHPAMDSVIADQAQSGDATSAHSTGKMDPQAPGWTRVRVGKHPPDRAPCPDRVGALEQMIQGYTDKLGPNVIEPEIGLTFDSLGEAYKKKGAAPVHVAPACAGSGEGSDHFGSIVRSLSLMGEAYDFYNLFMGAWIWYKIWKKQSQR